jgi:acyl-CoA thioesterase YciA
MPADTNPDGDIFGGWILSQMDLASGTFASQEARGRVVTVAVDGMTFHKPVYVGDELSCYCKVLKRGRSSLAIQVETWVQRHHSHRQEQVTEGTFTLVAIDADGRPRPLSNGAQCSG